MRHWAEVCAREYFLTQGYKILSENYTSRWGELDLIVFKDGITIFVEVKQRKSNTFGSAAESISPQKLNKMTQTALQYMVQEHKRDDLPMRFDAVLLSGVKAAYDLEHLENILQ